MGKVRVSKSCFKHIFGKTSNRTVIAMAWLLLSTSLLSY